MTLEPLERGATEVAPLLLGAVLRLRGVSIRLTEVEAYGGVGEDPGSHAFRGKTARNATMFGPAGRLYVYRVYGIHAAANLVTGHEGTASAVLLRAGEIVDGLEEARRRRATARSDAELARGPGRLAQALGITLEDNGAIAGKDFELHWPDHRAAIATGPRTGVGGPGGSADFPWRFRIPGDPTVSPYREHRPRRRPSWGDVSAQQ